jgi:DNA-binding MarR family transcriptional regulator
MPREDLGAMFARITRRLIAAERPLLAARELSMWEYVALSQLAVRPAAMQAELAQAIGYDKTRLIALLDGLESRGLITRVADPADRRARRVGLTPRGRRLHASARADIRAMEKQLLDTLAPRERKAMLAALARLAATAPPS